MGSGRRNSYWAHPPPPPPPTRGMVRGRGSSPVVVVAPKYCQPLELSLAVTKNLRSSSRGDWTIRDPEGNILFRVDGTVRAVATRRDLLDDKGYKLIHMQRKLKVTNNNIFLLQQRGLKWCPQNPKPYIMNLSLSLSFESLCSFAC